MITETPTTHEPVGGDGLLLAIAVAVVLVVTAEAAFVAVGGYLALVATLVLALGATAAVIFALLHTIDADR